MYQVLSHSFTVDVVFTLSYTKRKHSNQSHICIVFKLGRCDTLLRLLRKIEIYARIAIAKMVAKRSHDRINIDPWGLVTITVICLPLYRCIYYTVWKSNAKQAYLVIFKLYNSWQFANGFWLNLSQCKSAKYVDDMKTLCYLLRFQ